MKHVRSYHRGYLITESKVEDKNIINVDIQPEYEDGFGHFLNKWVKFINKNSELNNIIFLYNGEYSGTIDISEDEYKDWLIGCGIKESVIESAIFYDKGYAFFRTCMDAGIDEQAIVDLVKYMIEHDITDSRDIDTDMWDDYMEETDHTADDVRDLLEEAGDMINIPELMDFLKRFRNIVLTGGGITACLKEVEIALMVLGKRYEILEEYTY
jgi:hypothetical protein